MTLSVPVACSLKPNSLVNIGGITSFHGALYVTDRKAHKIYEIVIPSDNNKDYQVILLAGCGKKGFLDGIGFESKFNEPCGIAIDTSGTIYVADMLNNAIRMIHMEQEHAYVSTLVGTLDLHSDVLIEADFLFNPCHMTIDSRDNLYVTEKHSSICLISLRQQQIWVLDDNRSKFNNICGMTVSPDEEIYISDSFNNRICMLSETVTGYSFGYQDGHITQAKFYYPEGIANDNQSNLFVVDSCNQRIRKVDLLSKLVTTVAQVPLNQLAIGWTPLCYQKRNLFVATNQVNTAFLVKIYAPALEWKVERLLWLAKLKLTPNECHIAKLPREIIIEILCWLLHSRNNKTDLNEL